MVFQNEQRPRTGKLSRKKTYDLSVRWLLESFKEMPVVSDHLVIVPVMTSYDRLFETRNLADEMMQGDEPPMTLKDVGSK